ncbi:MAG: VWA domain-containing protein [Thermoanaerobaculia bacterium]
MREGDLIRAGRRGATLVGLLAALAIGPAAGAPPSSPTPGAAAMPAPTPTAEEARRRSEAVTLFGRPDDDRAVVHVLSGPPDARTIVHCSALFREVEVWTYLEHPKLGRSARAIFFPEPGTGVYRYWTMLDGEALLLAPNVHLSFETFDAEKSLCAEAAVLKAAVVSVTARQKDKSGGLEERAAVAVGREALAKAAPAASAPVPVLVSNKPLTGKERRKLESDLPDRYRKFLEDVEPIITELERDTLLRLTTDYQRERFVDEFWKRRSIGPDGLRIEFRDIYELRVQQAREIYRNLRSDMARIYILHGPPDGVRKIDCQDVFWPIQIWYYERIDALRMSKVLLLFYQSFGGGDYRLWTPADGRASVTAGALPGGGGTNRRVDMTTCLDASDVLRAMSQIEGQWGTTGGMKMAGVLREGPKPDDVEGADAILQMTTDIPPDAIRLPVQRTLRFPETVGSKMRMELTLLLEREGLATKIMGPVSFFDFDVIGEVVKGDRLIDNFRYRFDFPTTSVSGPFVPLKIEREIFPGEYRIKVKVADANRNAAGLFDEKVQIPDVADVTPSAEEKAAREAGRTAVARLVSEAGKPKGTILLLPIAREFATGLIRFETRTSSPDVAAADFYLDNVKVTSKRRPPFSVDLDLGELPRRHVVKVVAIAKDGKVLGEDELTLNEGREAFRVRITAPDKGAKLAGPVRLVADLAVPETKELQDVEFFVNETRAAVLKAPPWEKLVDVPKSKDLGFLRVVATLTDGSKTEDLRYYNAPKYLTEERVQAIELFTSVLAKGRPVTGLSKEQFSVFEDGVSQTLDGFEVVTNLPLSIGVGIDTSGSMEETLVEAQKAANEFLKDVMTPRDRCFLLNFDNEPQLVIRFTTDRERLAQAMAGMRAQGSTALWDAIVYGLFQFQGVRGRKAYVILTDGEDRSSKFPFEAALDYAKKSGVALYFIGLRIPGAELSVRAKLSKLGRETGGAAYFVNDAQGVARIYAEINEELRSQYLLSYLPQNKTPGNMWRKIEVKMTPSNLVARTISGYYP